MKSLIDFNYDYEIAKKFGWHNGLVAGIDEVGRGSIAGPLVVGIVAYSPDTDFLHLQDINDSKKLSAKDMARLVPEIKTHAIYYDVAVIDEYTISQGNIDDATIKAITNLKQKHDNCIKEKYTSEFSCILMDGDKFRIWPNTINMTKGDTVSPSIASASILAKVEHDEIMCKAAEIWPQYEFEKNMGYGTKAHFEKIEKYGISPIHRTGYLKKYFEKKKLFTE